MKKRTQKIMAMLLSAVLMISGTTFNANAMSIEEKSFPIVQREDGYWEKTASSVFSVREDSIVVSEAENKDGIFISEDGNYFKETENNTYVPVEKISLPLSDYNSYETLKGYNLPNEVMEGIAAMAALAEENGSNDAKVCIFVNDTNARYNFVNVKRTTWNGNSFNHYEVYFENMHVGWFTVSKGSSITQTALTAIKDLVANNAGGTLGSAINLFNNAQTCLSAWQSIKGTTPIYGSSGNEVESKIYYDIYLKYTFYVSPYHGEVLGCSSQKVIINMTETDVTLMDSKGGDNFKVIQTPNKEYKTSHYTSPEETAYYHQISGYTETASAKIYNYVIHFTYPDDYWPSGWPSNWPDIW